MRPHEGDEDHVRRRDYFAGHPGLHGNDHDLVWEGKIRLGFSQEEVVASLDVPTSMSKRTVSTLGSWSTSFYPRLTIVFGDGKLISWTE
jgi:hypothetical protein